MALCKSVIRAIFLLVESGGNSSSKDDDFILILITCKYTHFWDFTVYTNNFVMLEDVTNTLVMGQ
jgi:hypothetical protein